jgi:uncharacterized membrane protein affecting hemolysin expression
MEEFKKIDLKKYQTKKVKSTYIIKICIYLVVLISLLYLVFKKSNVNQNNEQINEIQHIKIDNN